MVSMELVAQTSGCAWPSAVGLVLMESVANMTRDGTVEPVSRDQILRYENADRVNYPFSSLFS